MDGSPHIEDFDDRDFDPFSVTEKMARQGDVADVYSELHRLQDIKTVWEMDPRLHFNTETDGTLAGIKKWVVLGYKDVSNILMRPKIFSSKIMEINLGQMFGRSITLMDPPEHTMYRKVFQKAFFPEMLDDWKHNLVPKIVNTLIANFRQRGRADLMSEFSLQFPFTFVTELLRLPPEDRRIFHRLAFAQTTVRYDHAHATEAGRKLTNYLTGLVAERRKRPPSPDDFVHIMATAEVDGERLPDIVVISFLRQLMNAAGDTSFMGFSNILTGLLNNPDQFDAVKKNRDLVPVAIEEGLRWEPPIIYVERTPTEEVVLGGETIKPGEHISVAIGTANRDRSVYENADSYDIFRKAQPNLAFGRGNHVCLGQHLARVEMAGALSALIDQLPNLRRDPNAPPPQVHGVTLRRPKGLPIVFDV